MEIRYECHEEPIVLKTDSRQGRPVNVATHSMKLSFTKTIPVKAKNTRDVLALYQLQAVRTEHHQFYESLHFEETRNASETEEGEDEFSFN